MPKFAYIAVDTNGATTTGTQRADTREAAEIALYEREFRHLRLTEKPGLLKREVSAPRVKREVIMHISRQMAAFIRAGLPILDAVHALSIESVNSSVSRMMADVEDGLRSGDTLSDCLDRHPKIFPEYYRGILRSAELTGQLDVVLDQLADYLERDLEAKRQIKAAMIYPAVISVMGIVTVVILSAFVLPKFKVFFANLHATLPLPTRMLLAFTNLMTQWWWAILAGLMLTGLSLFLALKTERGRHAKDGFVLRLPVVGDTVQYALVERFARILASMVNAGVSLPESLRVSTESLHNLVYTRALYKVAESMLEGEGLAAPLAATKLFPSTAVQMIRVGEDTGTLDGQLEVTARYYEAELAYKIKKLTALFEPAVIVIMGVIVGFVAVALVSAMYGVFNQVKK